MSALKILQTNLQRFFRMVPRSVEIFLVPQTDKNLYLKSMVFVLPLTPPVFVIAIGG